MGGMGGMGYGPGYPMGYGNLGYGMGNMGFAPPPGPSKPKQRSGSICSASTATSLGRPESVASMTVPSPTGSTPRSDAYSADSTPRHADAVQPSQRAAPSVQRGAKLGEGDFSAVYRGTVDGRAAAIKVIAPHKPANRGRNLQKDFDEEVRALKQLRHPHCLELIHAENLTIVTDLAEGKPLSALLYTERKRFEPGMAAQFAQQLAGCIAHIHRIPLLHRDLKPENVMVDTHAGQIKLIDFGMAMAPSGGPKKATFDGSPLYGAPETLQGYPATTQSEVWALACVTCELFGLGRPYGTQRVSSLAELTHRVNAGMKPYPGATAQLPRHIQAVVERVFTRQVERRPEAAELA